MKKLVFHLTTILILFCLVLAGCSGSKKPDHAKADEKTSTEQAVGVINDYRDRTMGKARATQHLGEERTKAIDDALEHKD